MSKRVGLRYFSIVAGKKKVVVPAAWNYDNLVGNIWLEGIGHNGYDVAPSGEIEVRDPYGTAPAGDLNGGSYDNR